MNCSVCDNKIIDTGETLITITPNGAISDQHGLIICHWCALDGIIYPEMKKSIVKLLIYTFSDINYNYDDLTYQEKLLYTKSEFSALVSLIPEKDKS